MYFHRCLCQSFAFTQCHRDASESVLRSQILEWELKLLQAEIKSQAIILGAGSRRCSAPGNCKNYLHVCCISWSNLASNVSNMQCFNCVLSASFFEEGCCLLAVLLHGEIFIRHQQRLKSDTMAARGLLLMSLCCLMATLPAAAAAKIQAPFAGALLTFSCFEISLHGSLDPGDTDPDYPVLNVHMAERAS